MRCDLTGKVSLVTGAAQGIGQEIAEQLAANGSTVVFTDLDEAGVREAAARVPGAKWRVMDVTRGDQVEEVVGGIVADLGQLDVVVNNAGVNTLQGRVTIDRVAREEWDRILAVDLTGLFEVSRFSARVMLAQRSGGSSTSRRSPVWSRCGFRVHSWPPRRGSST